MLAITRHAGRCVLIRTASSVAAPAVETTTDFPSVGGSRSGRRSSSSSGSASSASCPVGHTTMTKIVCTLGPSSDKSGPVNDLVAQGMHVARLNFSHSGSDYAYPEANMSLVRDAPGMHAELSAGAIAADGGGGEEALPRNVRAILVDTKGPEIRTGPLQGGADVAEIATGATVELTTQDVSGDVAPATPDGPHRIQVDYQSIARTMSGGGTILLDDGLLALEVTDVDEAGGSVTCRALNGGPIKRNKGVNLPNVALDLPALTEKDKSDLRWACRAGADYVAASFIRTPGNVRSVVAYLDRCIADLRNAPLPPIDCTGVPMSPIRPLVISKIESKEGVDNFREILRESDGIMVARGDLGVEIPYSKVFAAQKMMVRECNDAGKPVIVATQMLDSMQRNPRPTRAEVTDVGTAVLDGADAVMLSGETAAGKYPIESIRAMVSVVTEADSILDSGRTVRVDGHGSEARALMSPVDAEMDSVAESAVGSARDMGAKLIIVITMSGRVARTVARHRPTVPVLAFCTDVRVARQLQLHRSVTPVLLQSSLDPGCSTTRMGLLRAEAVRTARELGFLRPGDRYVTVDRTIGKAHDMHAYSHNMKVATLRES